MDIGETIVSATSSSPVESPTWRRRSALDVAGIDLASKRVGGVVLYASDEFFGTADNVLKPERPLFDPKTYSINGKVYDGWETRRHAGLDPIRRGRDFCIIRLGCPGYLNAVDIDTLWFVENCPMSAMVEATEAPAQTSWVELQRDVAWFPIVLKTELHPGEPGNAHNLIPVVDGDTLDHGKHRRRFTHVRLTIFPDGGVARLRIYGHPAPDFACLRSLRIGVDLASIVNGGRVVAASNGCYSHPDNLLLPDRALNMSEGWETARSRDARHYDWVVVMLGTPGVISDIELDTNHFRTNYPNAIRIEGAVAKSSSAESDIIESLSWEELVPTQEGKPHARIHIAVDSTSSLHDARVSHLRLITIPDGGVSRLRVFSRVF